jgi:hypothetical protein
LRQPDFLGIDNQIFKENQLVGAIKNRYHLASSRDRGIGILSLQNINLLNYRAASAQMLAIAIVIALMDFLSSYMRERVV